jgi:hypothetical protein
MVLMSKKARAGVGAPETNSSRISRRAFLAAGAGASVLVAVPDLFLAGAAHAQAAVPAAGGGRFFLYGTTGPNMHAAIDSWQPPAKGMAAPKPSTVASALAALPVKSHDGTAVAVPTVRMMATGAAVTVSIVSTDVPGTQSSATLQLPGVPSDALVLVRPVFAGSSTVALMLAVSVPSPGGMFTKTSTSGEPMNVPAVSWTTNHHLAYLDRDALTFTGPFDLASAPSLAWTDTVADEHHLYVWTMKEPAAGAGKTSMVPVSPPRLVAYKLGTGEASLSMRSPGAWPAGQNGHVLQTNDIVRLVDGRDLEVFTPASGRLARVPLAPLDTQTAKPGVTNIHHRPDGTLVVANAAIGRAFVVDPASSFATSGVIDFPRPAIPLGGSDSKTALSPDGTVLFALGAADAGGLSAIDLATGALIASFSKGTHYGSVHRLPGGSLVAVNPGEGRSQLDFFSPSLAPLGTSTTGMYVAEVF